MKDHWVTRFEVVGSKGDTWIVAQKDTGIWGCSCPAWKFHKAPKVHCKHIKAMLAAFTVALPTEGRKFRWEDVDPVVATSASTTYSPMIIPKQKPSAATEVRLASVSEEEFTVTRKFREFED